MVAEGSDGRGRSSSPELQVWVRLWNSHSAPGGGRTGSPSLCSPSTCHFPGTGVEAEGSWVSKAPSLPEQWYSKGPVGTLHPGGVHTLSELLPQEALTTLCLLSSEPSTGSARGDCSVGA